MQEIQVWSLGREDPLKKEMATHSSIPAWEIPWTEEPGGYSPWSRKTPKPPPLLEMELWWGVFPPPSQPRGSAPYTLFQQQSRMEREQVSTHTGGHTQRGEALVTRKEWSDFKIQGGCRKKVEDGKVLEDPELRHLSLHRLSAHSGKVQRMVCCVEKAVSNFHNCLWANRTGLVPPRKHALAPGSCTHFDLPAEDDGD